MPLPVRRLPDAESGFGALSFEVIVGSPRAADTLIHYRETVVGECRVIHRAPSGRSRLCCGFSGGFLLRTQHGPNPEEVEQIMDVFG
jgi:hypothetical protein